MRIPILALALVPALSTAPSARIPPARSAAQEGRGGDVAQLLSDQLEAAASSSTEEIWRRAGRLADASRELGSSEELAAAVERRLASPELGEAQVLFLASLRLLGSDPDPALLALRLEPVLDSKVDAYAAGAAGLLADAHFKLLSSERREALLSALEALAQDPTRAPEVRLASAVAAFQNGGGAERTRARRQMLEFLRSSDSELRARGALALASVGSEVTGELYDELRRLSALPGERGSLAASYLERERVRELSERKLKNVLEVFGEKAAAAEPEPGSEDTLSQVQRVLEMIQRMHLEGDKVTREQLLDAAMDGMLRAMDEHSAFLAPKEFAKFEQDLEAGYGGIGAYVQEDQDGLFTITHPIYSGPAYKAGLLSEDKIVRIDDWPTLGHPSDEIIKRLKGRPGTPVKLYVWRAGMDPALIERPTEDMAVTILRDAIVIPTVQHQMLPGKIGMVSLRDFSRVATQELQKPLLGMLDDGMQAMILDLRNNHGGLLDEAVDVAGLFLPKGSLVVSTESRVEARRSLHTSRPPILPPDMPLVVLINRFSASAAEIVAGALQDHGRAVLVGKTTFGKGSVQNLLQLHGSRDDKFEDENGNGRWDNWEPILEDYNGNGEFDFAPRVKLTIARYLLPSGRSIHREIDKEGNVTSEGGVRPDQEVAERQYEGWRLKEMNDLRQSGKPRDYVDGLWGEYQGLLEGLAENDRRDPNLYPGFDTFYGSLQTPLSKDDVRRMVRLEVRRRAQDARGQEFPQGDFVEDTQLQEAIRLLLQRRGETPLDFEAYIAVIPPAPQADGPLLVAGADPMQETLDAVRAALRGEGQLSGLPLARLAEILEAKLDK